jgi:IS30 family transposase
MPCLVTMSQKELHRLEAVQKVKDDRLTVSTAAKLLSISRSHMHRLLQAYDLCLRRRHVPRKLVRYPGLRAMVIDRLRNSWSPEQIAGRLKTDGASPLNLHQVESTNLWR